MTVQRQKSKPHTQGKKSWLPVFAGFLVCVALIAAYFNFVGVKRVRWTEEVALVDGSIIHVTQQRKFINVSYELFHPGWSTRYNKITFPDGVSFEASDRIGLMHVERGALPVQWILIASPFYCEEFNKYGRPKPDYIQFEYANGHWSYRAVQPEFFGRKVNLNANDQIIVEGKRTGLTLADKAYWNSVGHGIGRNYLRINPAFASGCPPIILSGEKQSGKQE